MPSRAKRRKPSENALHWQTNMPRQPLQRIPEATLAPALHARRSAGELSGMADPAVWALYEEIAAKEGKGAFAAARTDYFNGKNLFSKK